MESQTPSSITSGRFVAAASLLLCSTIALSGGPVESVQLKTKSQKLSQLPTIVVGNNGSRFTRIITRQISVPLEFSARCSGQTKLVNSAVGIGRLPISHGHMADKRPAHSQTVKIEPNTKAIGWHKVLFRVRLNSQDRFANIDPVKACNDFLQKKMQQGMKASFFMQKDRKMTMQYEISFAAQCRKKWKAYGMWKQTTKPARAIIVCKGR